MRSPLERLYYPTDEESPVLIRRRLFIAALAGALVFIFGTLGYLIMGQGQWSLIDCAYMVVLTVTTIGYGEILPVHQFEYGRPFTMLLMLLGTGVSIYALSALTAFIVEGDLREVIWRRKMKRQLKNLSDHYIVCGAGQTGRGVIEILLESGTPTVVIERDPEHLHVLSRHVGEEFIGIIGDATEDLTLIECRVEHAKGIIACLQSDQDNLFVTLTARDMNAELRIVSRAVGERAGRKLIHAGANAVVSPNSIGGRRMANEMLKPSVVGFIDLLVGDLDRSLTVGECLIPKQSPLDGVYLADSGIRQEVNVLVLSILCKGGAHYEFNPPPSFRLQEGMTLVVLGEKDAIERLEAYVKS